MYICILYIGISWIWRSRYDIARFDGKIWTFRPVKALDKSKIKGRKIEIFHEDIIRIDVPKFEKNTKNPKLLITFNAYGKEMTVESNSGSTGDILNDIHTNFPTLLGSEAEKRYS
ncbi:hypothetical protein K9N50_01980 [bacterium]|nr:hypothetical protein [bacterium]